MAVLVPWCWEPVVVGLTAAATAVARVLELGYLPLTCGACKLAPFRAEPRAVALSEEVLFRVVDLLASLFLEGLQSAETEDTLRVVVALSDLPLAASLSFS